VEPHTHDGNTLGKFSGRETESGRDGRWDIDQPKSTEERVDQAQKWYADMSAYLVSKGAAPMKVPYCVDSIENEVDKAYLAYPFRYGIVKDGKVEYRAPRGPPFQDLISIKSVRKYLQKL